jgi:hypothetical protein
MDVWNVENDSFMLPKTETQSAMQTLSGPSSRSHGVVFLRDSVTQFHLHFHLDLLLPLQFEFKSRKEHLTARAKRTDRRHFGTLNVQTQQILELFSTLDFGV